MTKAGKEGRMESRSKEGQRMEERKEREEKRDEDKKSRHTCDLVCL